MKFTAIIFSVALTLFGASPTFAATPEDCVESDNNQRGVDCPESGLYPIVTPAPTAPPTTNPPPPVLPATGSSGSSGLLQIGGLMLAGGLLVVVASRRRTSASA